MCCGKAALDFDILGCDRGVATQVVAESKVPAFFLRTDAAQMDVMCAWPRVGPFEEWVDRINGPEWDMAIAEVGKWLCVRAQCLKRCD